MSALATKRSRGMDEPGANLLDARPPLMRDPSFWGMTVTQFLGAYNDNLYKEMALLICLDFAGKQGEDPFQGPASIVFAAPFVLFSGFAGFLADRNSKRSIVVLCKFAEIFVMLAGLVALTMHWLVPIFVVLFLMGTHSAFFGPAKYGILPEMVRQRDLPRANGIFLMTTFLAIILGFASAGILKNAFADRVWIASSACVVVAVIGTMTSLLVRPTPIAFPNLRFEPSALAVPTDTRRLLLRDKKLLGVLVATSVFWLIGGVIYPPAVNAMAKLQMRLDDQQTGYMAASTGIGIALGCVLAGRLSQGKVRFGLVTAGSWGIIVCLALLAAPGPMRGNTLLGQYGSIAALILLGMCAGFYTVPLQVFLQARAPEDQKGRIIGTMNLANWIGICLAGGIYWISNVIVSSLAAPPNLTFGLCAVLLLPVAIFYRPTDTELK